MGWQRARTPDQRTERSDEILRVAGKLLDAGGLEGAGLNAIARGVGCAKANLYRYFESREAILIRLLLDASVSWCEEMRRGLEGVSKGGTSPEERVDAVADVLAGELANRPRLCLLLDSTASVLEQNVDADTVVRMKREFMALAEPVVESLSRALGNRDREGMTWFLYTWTLSSCALWSAANPAEVVRSVLERDEFAEMRIDFQPSIRRLAVVMLRGLLVDDSGFELQ